jgi:predicted CXXCH cytochrome family protein
MKARRIIPLLAAFAVVALAVALATPGGACAQERVPYPEIAKGEGEACVRETAFMRSNHMDLLLHQRDQTMREGIRPERESLKACLTCHAVRDAGGQPVTAEDPKHFCRACHDYAAVRVDCFQCHDSRPPDTEGAFFWEPGAGLRLTGLSEP